MRIQVIVADDHPIALSGIRAILRPQASIRVVAEVSSPEQMMDALSQHQCDVLITDLTMPGREPDGLPMLEAVRRGHPEVRIVLFTVTTQLRLLQTALAYGVKGLVNKTAPMDALTHAVNAVMSGRTYIAQSLQRDLKHMATLESRTEGILRLSPREAEVLRLYAARHTVSEIASMHNRSVATISHQKICGMRKLGITTDAELHVFLNSGELRI